MLARDVTRIPVNLGWLAETCWTVLYMTRGPRSIIVDYNSLNYLCSLQCRVSKVPYKMSARNCCQGRVKSTVQHSGRFIKFLRTVVVNFNSEIVEIIFTLFTTEWKIFSLL